MLASTDSDRFPTECPCGSATDFQSCCGQYLAGRNAPTPEALMRSRFTAYVVGDESYVRRTWHPDTCPEDLSPPPGLKWESLTVEHVTLFPPTVTFSAAYRQDGQPGVMQERSLFTKIAGNWCYVEPLPLA
ncbi:YchJ family protein [Corynebacterium choanae]|uniref:YchJ-like middle NTF2-like domain-containing protein n=1 Tax=Corynebacterium choanae TaxID=1862358 RepID=A0A3G6J6Q8_9CORY|nr:YchJ family metal-binding protein [Corynebacterium choanae]AZA13502.1 hypothetical protein CCHOA_05510 [Corynebacterium choanae]